MGYHKDYREERGTRHGGGLAGRGEGRNYSGGGRGEGRVYSGGGSGHGSGRNIGETYSERKQGGVGRRFEDADVNAKKNPSANGFTEGSNENDDAVTYIEGRNAVLEAFRAGKTIDKLFILDGCQDGPIKSILREAGKQDTIISYVKKERLDQLSKTGAHQGVAAFAAAYEYAEVSDILQRAKDKGEDPFIFILDGIEDPHNLGAIIRTANLCGAHGVIIPKRRAVGLTSTVAKTSAGALNYTPVAKVTNLSQTMEELKAAGLWFVCADMDGDVMYRCNLTGPIGLVIGNEGEGVSRLVRENCDMVASIPMKGDIDSLNASVAAGVLAYEIVRQRLAK